MKALILSLCLLLSTLAQGAPRFFQKGDAQYVDPASVSYGYLVPRPMQIEGFSGESMDKLHKAFEVLETVVNSETFKEQVLNFKNKKGERKFASNNGFSNEQIFAMFMDGRELLQPNTPNEMNFFLKLYNRSWSKVIGWTNGKINTININWKFFKTFSPDDVAGNLAHEWTHKIGFDHTSAAEHDSVPYAIGYIVRDLSIKVLDGQKI